MKKLVIFLFFILVSTCNGTWFMLLEVRGDTFTSHLKPITDSSLDIGTVTLYWRYVYGDAFTDGTAKWENSDLTGFDDIIADSFTDGFFLVENGIITGATWNGGVIDISDYTNLTGGLNITLVDDTFNIDDAFLVNDGDDTTTGIITSAGLTTTGAVTAGASTFGDGGTTDYTEINSLGSIVMHGNARVEKHMHIGAPSWRKGATAPTETYENIFPTISFNTGQDDQAHYTALVPFEWDDTTDMEVHLHWQQPDDTDNGNVFWKLKYIGVKEGEDPAGAGTEITQLSAGNHPQDEIIDTIFTTKILAANLERVDDLGLMLWRHGTDGSDDLGEDAELIAMHIHYTMNQLGDPILAPVTDVLLLDDGASKLFLDDGASFLLLRI